MDLTGLSKITDSLDGVTYAGVKFSRSNRDTLERDDARSMFKIDKFENVSDSFKRYCNSKELQYLVDCHKVTRKMYENKKFRDDFEKMYAIIDEMNRNNVRGDFYITTPNICHRVLNGVTMNEIDLDSRIFFSLNK